MGLDMFMKKVDKQTGKTLNDELMYWRKANQIRQWFVKNTGYPEDGNCIDHSVTKEQLEKLVADCRAVLNNHRLARKIMPTSDGFFFGGTEYDEWYYRQLESTANEVGEIIADTDLDSEEIIYTEWW